MTAEELFPRQPYSKGCACDYCTGKRDPREWCAYCGTVRLRPDQNGFEDMDFCDACNAIQEDQWVREVLAGAFAALAQAVRS